MKDQHVLFNPFRMLSPKLDAEAIRLEVLHEQPVSESLTLEEGLLTMTSKLIEMTRCLSKYALSVSADQMDKCQVLGEQVHDQEAFLTKNLVVADVSSELRRGLLRFPYRLERIGDLLESILRCCRIKARDGIPFSDIANAELEQMFSSLLELMINLRDAFRAPNKALLRVIISQTKRLSQMVDDFRLAHWERLEAGFCAVAASSLYRDILDSVKWITEYLEKMAVTLLEIGEAREKAGEA